MVVAGYDLPKGQPVRVTLGPHLTGLKGAAAEVAGPLRQVRLSLAPATAVLLECAVDVDNLPQVYADDLSTEKYKTDAAEVRNVKRYVEWGNLLSAGDGGATPEQAYVMYDVDKRLGPLPPGGLRVLTYEGSATPPEFRGAFWSASADGKEYTKLSANEFGRPVPFTGRYLKVGLSWRQASAAHYGGLSRFSIAQWKRAVK
jgi:hypothetical protein